MIETERLLLRPPQQEDADSFFEIFSDAETCRADGGYPPFEKRDEAFQATFAAIAADPENRLFAVEKGSGKMIGVLHLMDAEEADGREIGYVIHRSFRRRGYASEMLAAVLDRLKQQGVRRAVCTVYAFNLPSMRMLEKLGFSPEGQIQKENPEWNEKIYGKRLV